MRGRRPRRWLLRVALCMQVLCLAGGREQCDVVLVQRNTWLSTFRPRKIAAAALAELRSRSNGTSPSQAPLVGHPTRPTPPSGTTVVAGKQPREPEVLLQDQNLSKTADQGRSDMTWLVLGCAVFGVGAVAAIACCLTDARLGPHQQEQSTPGGRPNEKGLKQAPFVPRLPSLQRHALAAGARASGTHPGGGASAGAGECSGSRSLWARGAMSEAVLKAPTPVQGAAVVAACSPPPGEGCAPGALRPSPAPGGSSASAAAARGGEAGRPGMPPVPGGPRFTFGSLSGCGLGPGAWPLPQPTTGARESSPAAASPVPSTTRRTEGKQLCPCLVVPDGHEMNFAVRDLLTKEKQQLSFSVVDLEERPVTHVIVNEVGPHAGILIQLLDQTPLAWVRTKAVHEGRGMPEICYPSGEMFCTVAKEEAVPTSGYTLRDKYGLRLCTMHGDFREKAVNVVNPSGRLICETERCELGSDGTPYYQVRVAPGVDVCLVLCGLLAVDKLEGGSEGSPTHGPMSARMPGPLTARSHAAAAAAAAGGARR
mmetsp:Transcript_108148/g.345395  ORF Transcript_108148/g.345395 Transcript_108148/m.345395 type:complete len:539 (+) Transcript_108148:69-1685(+)